MELNQDICEHSYMNTFYLCHVGRDKICEKIRVWHPAFSLDGESWLIK